MNEKQNGQFDITRDAILIKLSIGRYSGRVKSNRLSREAAQNHNADAEAIDSAIRTLAKEDHVAIDRVVNEARTLWWNATVPWEDEGRRLCPTVNYPKLMRKLRELNDQFVTEVEKLVKRYEEVEAAARKRLGNLVEEVRFPSKEELIACYYWTVQEDVVTNLKDVRLSHVNAEQLNRIVEERSKRVETTLQEAQRDVALRLAQLMENIVKRFSEDDPTFRDTLIGNVRDALEVLPTLNLLHDERITKALNRAKVNIASLEPETLRNDPALRKKTKKNAEDVLQELSAFTTKKVQP